MEKWEKREREGKSVILCTKKMHRDCNSVLFFVTLFYPSLTHQIGYIGINDKIWFLYVVYGPCFLSLTHTHQMGCWYDDKSGFFALFFAPLSVNHLITTFWIRFTVFSASLLQYW